MEEMIKKTRKEFGFQPVSDLEYTDRAMLKWAGAKELDVQKWPQVLIVKNLFNLGSKS